MALQNKRILVTGAGGFIGSHLTERLVQIGAKVRAFVHYNALSRTGWLDESAFCNDIEIFAGDICDRDSVIKAMSATDIVFHLAALIGIPYSYHAPDSYVRTNIGGTLNVLQAAREIGVSRVVHTSTSEVYGTARFTPMSEEHPLQCQSPYSASKTGADKMVEAFHLSFGLPIVTLRPFNAFGPRQSARAIIPTIITQCLTSNVVYLGSLHPSRDFNFVSNTVDGYLLAATAENAIGKTFNLGSGREISVADLVQLIASLIGKSIEVKTESQRLRPKQSEVDRLVACSTFAEAVLGWKPKVCLEDGLKITINWIEQNATKYRPGSHTL